MIQVRHVGIVVTDLDLMLDFYVNLLGLKVLVRGMETGEFIENLLGLDDVTVETVKLIADDGPTLVELLKFIDPPPVSDPREKYINRSGLSHLAFTVSDVDSTHRQLKFSECEIIAPPRLAPDGKAKVLFFRDPEGNFVELVTLQNTGD